MFPTKIKSKFRNSISRLLVSIGLRITKTGYNLSEEVRLSDIALKETRKGYSCGRGFKTSGQRLK